MKTFDNSSLAGRLSKVACTVPFTQLHIFNQGDVCHCCVTWLPTYIGNVNSSTLLQMIENKISKNIQKSVTDSTFSYCSTELCPKLAEYINLDRVALPLVKKEEFKIKPKSIVIFMDYDWSCNLYCGSCRNERILYTEESAPAHLRLIHKNVLKQLQELIENGYELNLNITGSGDPFASPLYWNFLKDFSLINSDQVSIGLNTNGTLMTRERLSHPYAQRLKSVSVSVDAFTEDTYKVVRRGGSFSALTQNLQNLDSMVVNSELQSFEEWQVNFIVQADNYAEMAKFAKWAVSSFESISMVWFNLIADWGHFNSGVFDKKAVWNSSHPEHEKFLDVLRDPIFDDPKVFVGNMAQYRNKALNII